MKKILLNSLYVLVTLLSLAFIYLFFIFNPNDYKEHITNYISSKTKYNVIINGDIKVSYYPDIKVLIPDIQVLIYLLIRISNYYIIKKYEDRGFIN